MTSPIPILHGKRPSVPIDIRAFRCFIETAQPQNFTQATSSPSVTQPIVSKMVRQLKNEVGQPLLVHEGKQMRLTDVSRVIYARGQEMLDVMHRLTLEVVDLSSLGWGKLTVGIPPMVNLFFLPIVGAFRQRYPNLVLNLAEYGGKTMEQQVTSSELEVGTTILPSDNGLELATRQFAKYPVWVVRPCKAKWAEGRTVTLTALRDEPLLLLTEDFSLTRKLRQAFLKARIEPHIAARSRHWEFPASVTAAGLGTTFLPQPLVADLADRDKLAVARLTTPDMDWTLTHLQLPGRYLSHAARAWLATCQKVLGAWVTVVTCVKC